MQTFARSIVNNLYGTLNFIIGYFYKVKAFRKEETQTIIYIFVASSLPRRMGIRKIDRCVKMFPKIFEISKFRSVI